MLKPWVGQIAYLFGLMVLVAGAFTDEQHWINAGLIWMIVGLHISKLDRE